jgi:hypothetical protein
MFYQKELVPVRILKRTIYKIDKMLSTWVKKGIREVLIRWRAYSGGFDSWVPASSDKKI